MDDHDAIVLLSALFDGGSGDPDEWLDHLPCVGETCADLLVGALLLKAMERVVKTQWGRRTKCAKDTVLE